MRTPKLGPKSKYSQQPAANTNRNRRLTRKISHARFRLAGWTNTHEYIVFGDEAAEITPAGTRFLADFGIDLVCTVFNAPSFLPIVPRLDRTVPGRLSPRLVGGPGKNNA
jgi:hypothetical protein